MADGLAALLAEQWADHSDGRWAASWAEMKGWRVDGMKVSISAVDLKVK